MQRLRCTLTHWYLYVLIHCSHLKPVVCHKKEREAGKCPQLGPGKDCFAVSDRKKGGFAHAETQ